MNTAMIPFAQGMGFAIPSETIKRIMDQITRNGRVVRPWLGISGMDVNKFVARRYNLAVEQGVLLAEVLNEAPARDAGLRVGDILMKIGESKVEGMKDLVGALSHLAIGEEVSVQFVRNGDELRDEAAAQRSAREDSRQAQIEQDESGRNGDEGWLAARLRPALPEPAKRHEKAQKEHREPVVYPASALKHERAPGADYPKALEGEDEPREREQNPGDDEIESQALEPVAPPVY